MKSNNINWETVWKFGIIGCALIFLCIVFDFMRNKMASSGDQINAEQFAGLYFATPVGQLHNLKGEGSLVSSRTAPTGYICFDCDTTPILKDVNQYSEGGDPLSLTDKFLKRFDKNAWCLLHSTDLTCLRMKEAMSGSRRFLLHNRNSKKYFFAHL